MNRLLQLNKKEIKLWFLTYVVVLIIPLIINYFLFVHSKGIIDEEISNSREALISGLKRDIDQELFSLRQTALLVGHNSLTQKLISDDRSGLSDERKYSVIEYLDYMEIIMTSPRGNQLLLNLENSGGVYFNGIYAKEDFFIEYYLSKETFPNKMSWKKFIESKYRNDFVTLNLRTTMEAEDKYIAYATSLPFGSLYNTSATLLIMVNQKRIIEILDQYKISDESIVYIIDEQNRVVMSNDVEIEIEGLNYEELIPLGHNQYGVRNGEEVVLIVEESDYIPWKYVIASDRDIYQEKDNNYDKVVIISMAIYLGVGSFMALWFSSRNYRPIGQMVKMVSNLARDSGNEENGGYDYLKSAFEDAFFKMDAMESKIVEQTNLMKSNFIFRLLTGITKDQELIRESLNQYGYHYNKAYFYTVILNVGLQSSSESTPSLNTYIKVAKYFKAIPLLAEESEYIIRDSYIIFVVNSMFNDLDSLKEELFVMVYQLKKEMADLMDVLISVGISSCHDSVFSLSEAYTESMNCLEYAALYDPEEVLEYKDIVSRGNYYYPISLEEKLINYMKAGNAKEAVLTLDEVYRTNFDENKIGINMGRNLLFDISSSMLKAIDTVAMNEMNFSMDIHHAVIFTKKIDEIKTKLKKVLIDICGYYEKLRENIEKTSYYYEVNQYIELHYKNPDLNISLIAEEFNLTPSYLSRLYKRESGDSILNYINKTRVIEAKRLLIESDLTNTEIAMSIGILNDTSFNRVFKSFEGITPGRYRKNNL